MLSCPRITFTLSHTHTHTHTQTHTHTHFSGAARFPIKDVGCKPNKGTRAADRRGKGADERGRERERGEALLPL